MLTTKLLGLKLSNIILGCTILIFFLVSFRSTGNGVEEINSSLPRTINLIQEQSLNVVIILIIFIVFLWLLTGNFTRFKRPSIAVFCYLIFQQTLALTQFVHDDDIQRFFIQFIFNMLLFIYVGIILRDWKFSSSSEDSILPVIFWGIFGFIFLNVVLNFLGIGDMFRNGRFYGLTSHPNFIGMCGGACSVLSLSLFLKNKLLKRKLIYFFAFFAGLYITYISDSRSALLATFVGSYFAFNSNIKNDSIRLLTNLTALVISLAGIIYIVFYDFNLNDYSERGNTRSDAWTSLLDIVKTIPLWGANEKLASENSYLYSVAAAGILGSSFLFVSIFFLVKRFISMYKILDYQNYFISGYMGITAFILLGALFEGFMLDSLSIPVFIFWLLLSFADSQNSTFLA